MWQAELAEATVALGKRLFPSAQQGIASLLDAGGLLPSSFKSRIAQGLPELSLEGAGSAKLADGAKVADGAKFAADGSKILDGAKPLERTAKPVDMHVSSSPDLKLHDVDPGEYFKPKGLWASDKFAWVPQQGPISHFDVVRGFAYHVDTSGARILNISTREHLQDLIRNFGKPNEFPSRLEGKISLPDVDLSKIGRATEPELRAFSSSDINWRELAKSYDGMRVSDYMGIKRGGPVPQWFDGLDLSSSVTWNNVGKVKVTPMGKVPSFYDPAFQEKMKVMLGRATEL